MGGSFIDCNAQFCLSSGLTKAQLCNQSVFDFTAQDDLQMAFDRLTQMLSVEKTFVRPLLLRGALETNPALGLRLVPIWGSKKNGSRDTDNDDEALKFLCVSLVQNPVIIAGEEDTPMETDQHLLPCIPKSISMNRLKRELVLQQSPQPEQQLQLFGGHGESSKASSLSNSPTPMYTSG